MVFEERGEERTFYQRKEILLKDFMNELRTIISSSPIKVLEIIGEEAKEFVPLNTIAEAIARKLEITTENAFSIIRLIIMLRLVEYDDMEDKARALEPVTRFILRFLDFPSTRGAEIFIENVIPKIC